MRSQRAARRLHTRSCLCACKLPFEQQEESQHRYRSNDRDENKIPGQHARQLPKQSLSERHKDLDTPRHEVERIDEQQNAPWQRGHCPSHVSAPSRPPEAVPSLQLVEPDKQQCDQENRPAVEQLYPCNAIEKRCFSDAHLALWRWNGVAVNGGGRARVLPFDEPCTALSRRREWIEQSSAQHIWPSSRTGASSMWEARWAFAC